MNWLADESSVVCIYLRWIFQLLQFFSTVMIGLNVAKVTACSLEQ